MIPKILHLYWGQNKPLSYLRALTVLTFHKLNPDWRINVYYPNKTTKRLTWKTYEHKNSWPYCGEDWMEKIKEIDNVEIIKVNLAPFNMISEVSKSDLQRWKILYEMGGVWSDFDIIYIRPMLELFQHDDVFLCPWNNRNGIVNPVGFMAGSKNCDFFSIAHNMAKVIIRGNEQQLGYQDLGRFLLDRLLYNVCDQYKIKNLPTETVYPLIASEGDMYWAIYQLPLTDKTIGLHWFAGRKLSAFYENKITGPEKIKEYKQLAIFREIVL